VAREEAKMRTKKEWRTKKRGGGIKWGGKRGKRRRAM
jgi:hypothetical protein